MLMDGALIPHHNICMVLYVYGVEKKCSDIFRIHASLVELCC